jgi:ABC-2 type transport system ATP-binding protein
MWRATADPRYDWSHMESALRCRELAKTYDGGVEAVRGIDLTIPVGECFGLLGPNGAGKTTTIEMLEGLLEPTRGEIEILGRHWGENDEAVRQRVGISLQETKLSDKLTVEETVELFRSFYTKRRSIEQILETTGLTEKRSSWVMKLSGGQRQRLAIACALVGDPDIVFLDEPTTGFDPQSRRHLWDVIREFRQEKKTVLLTTHYMEEAERLCDRVAIVDHGKIIALDSPRGLIQQLGGDHVVELEVDDEARVSLDELQALPSVSGAHRDGELVSLAVKEVHLAIPALMEYLESHGAKLEHLGTRHASLEDVFVSLTGRRLRNG